MAISLFDKNHQPLRNKTVTLHSQPITGKTNSKGEVIFKGVAPGTHHVIYTMSHQTYDQTLQVANNVQTVGSAQTAPIQNFRVVYSLVQPAGWGSSGWFGGFILMTTLIFVGAAILFIRWRSGALFTGFHLGGSDRVAEMPTVVTTESPAAVTERSLGLSPPAQIGNIPYPPDLPPGTIVAPYVSGAFNGEKRL